MFHYIIETDFHIFVFHIRDRRDYMHFLIIYDDGAVTFINISRKNNTMFLFRPIHTGSPRINKISRGLAFTCGTSHMPFLS